MIGDSIPFGGEDCGGCTPFVDLYASELGEQSGRTVEPTNLSTHDGLTSPQLLTRIQSEDYYRDAVAEADAVIAVTPVYQASFSGLFKTFVDVVDEGSLRGTPVLMAATAGTARHSLVLEHAMRPMFAYLKAVAVPTAVFAASEDWGSSGTVDEGLDGRIRVAAGELADLVAGGSAPRPRVDEYTALEGFEELLRRA